MTTNQYRIISNEWRKNNLTQFAFLLAPDGMCCVLFSKIFYVLPWPLRKILKTTLMWEFLHFETEIRKNVAIEIICRASRHFLLNEVSLMVQMKIHLISKLKVFHIILPLNVGFFEIFWLLTWVDVFRNEHRTAYTIHNFQNLNMQLRVGYVTFDIWKWEHLHTLTHAHNQC